MAHLVVLAVKILRVGLLQPLHESRQRLRSVSGYLERLERLERFERLELIGTGAALWPRGTLTFEH